MGLCYECWIRPVQPGFARCPKCLQYQRNWASKRHTGTRLQLQDTTKRLIDSLTDGQKGYIAGILDGEGCIRIGKRMSPTGFYRYFASVDVSNTNLPIIQVFSGLLGGPIQKRGQHRRNQHWKECHLWAIRGVRASTFLEAIITYLVGKRQQAELLVALEQEKAQRKRPLQGDLVRQENLYKACKLLNARGFQPVVDERPT